ncbi:MAG: sigma-70 family RNA polymerase sigma factor [Pseudomonadota bacterium]
MASREAAEQQSSEWASWPERIANGDQQAETELVRFFGPKIEYILRRRLRDPALAADLRQDTLIIVIQRLRGNGIDDADKLAAFIYKTAEYLANNHGRKRQRRNTHADSDQIDQTASQSPLLADVIERDELAQLVRILMDELSQPRDREILQRFYLSDEDKVDLCNEFEVTPAHFDRVLYRARKRFGELLEQRLGQDYLRAYR